MQQPYVKVVTQRTEGTVTPMYQMDYSATNSPFSPPTTSPQSGYSFGSTSPATTINQFPVTQTRKSKTVRRSQGFPSAPNFSRKRNDEAVTSFGVDYTKPYTLSDLVQKNRRSGNGNAGQNYVSQAAPSSKQTNQSSSQIGTGTEQYSGPQNFGYTRPLQQPNRPDVVPPIEYSGTNYGRSSQTNFGTQAMQRNPSGQGYFGTSSGQMEGLKSFYELEQEQIGKLSPQQQYALRMERLREAEEKRLREYQEQQREAGIKKEEELNARRIAEQVQRDAQMAEKLEQERQRALNEKFRNAPLTIHITFNGKDIKLTQSPTARNVYWLNPLNYYDGIAEIGEFRDRPPLSLGVRFRQDASFNPEINDAARKGTVFTAFLQPFWERPESTQLSSLPETIYVTVNDKEYRLFRVEPLGRKYQRDLNNENAGAGYLVFDYGQQKWLFSWIANRNYSDANLKNLQDVTFLRRNSNLPFVQRAGVQELLFPFTTQPNRSTKPSEDIGVQSLEQMSGAARSANDRYSESQRESRNELKRERDSDLDESRDISREIAETNNRINRLNSYLSDPDLAIQRDAEERAEELRRTTTMIRGVEEVRATKISDIMRKIQDERDALVQKLQSQYREQERRSVAMIEQQLEPEIQGLTKKASQLRGERFRTKRELLEEKTLQLENELKRRNELVKEKEGEEIVIELVKRINDALFLNPRLANTKTLRQLIVSLPDKASITRAFGGTNQLSLNAMGLQEYFNEKPPPNRIFQNSVLGAQEIPISPDRDPLDVSEQRQIILTYLCSRARERPGYILEELRLSGQKSAELCEYVSRKLGVV